MTNAVGDYDEDVSSALDVSGVAFAFAKRSRIGQPILCIYHILRHAKITEKILFQSEMVTI